MRHVILWLIMLSGQGVVLARSVYSDIVFTDALLRMGWVSDTCKHLTISHYIYNYSMLITSIQYYMVASKVSVLVVLLAVSKMS